MNFAGIILNFLGIILFQDQIVKGLSDFFLTEVDELGLDISNSGSQGYDNGAGMKIKEASTNPS